MGQVMGGIGKVFNPNSDEVKGTGQTVGDLKKIGYTADDLRTLGGGTPSLGVGLARGIIGGGLNGIAQRSQPIYPVGVPMMPLPSNGVPTAGWREQEGGWDLGGPVKKRNPFFGGQ